MEQNMTALVSLFTRVYHQKSKGIKIFDDPLSTKLITDKEYEMIGLNMSQGISFFNPTFKGSKEEALKWIVDHQLSPSVLVRSAFCKEAIEETGYEVGEVRKLFELYMSPGGVTELIHFFIAEYSDSQRANAGGGVEDEDIEVLELPFSQALEMIKTGEIRDGKTVLLLNYLQMSHLMD